MPTMIKSHVGVIEIFPFHLCAKSVFQNETFSNNFEGPSTEAIPYQRTENHRAGNRHFLFPIIGWLSVLSSEPLAGKVKLKVVCICFSTTSFWGLGGGETLLREIKLTVLKMWLFILDYADHRHLEYKNVSIQREELWRWGSHCTTYRNNLGKESLKLS